MDSSSSSETERLSRLSVAPIYGVGGKTLVDQVSASPYKFQSRSRKNHRSPIVGAGLLLFWGSSPAVRVSDTKALRHHFAAALDTGGQRRSRSSDSPRIKESQAPVRPWHVSNRGPVYFHLPGRDHEPYYYRRTILSRLRQPIRPRRRH